MSVSARVSSALENVPTLLRALPRMDETELIAALELEAQSRRRQSVINRLIGRLVAIRSTRLRQELRGKYRGR